MRLVMEGDNYHNPLQGMHQLTILVAKHMQYFAVWFMLA